VTFLKSVFFCFAVVLIIISLPLPAFLPHFPLWCSDPLMGQRASSWSRGLYFLQHHYMSSCVYSGFHNGPKWSQYRGIRQSNIRHAPKTRNIDFIKVLNPPTVGHQPLNRSLGPYSFQVCTGTWTSFFILLVISNYLFFITNL
jgi:hypothetical protein